MLGRAVANSLLFFWVIYFGRTTSQPVVRRRCLGGPKLRYQACMGSTKHEWGVPSMHGAVLNCDILDMPMNPYSRWARHPRALIRMLHVSILRRRILTLGLTVLSLDRDA